MDRLNHMPTSLIAGESVDTADIILAGYSPASGWGLSYQFAAAVPVAVAAVANEADTGWDISISAVTSLAFGSGSISYVGMATHTDGRAAAVDAGVIAVTPSPMRVSQWAAVVAAIDAAMLDGGSKTEGSISIDGMSTSYKNFSELITLREYALQQLRKDAVYKPRRIIQSRFTVCS